MRDIRSRLTDVPPHLPHNANMLVTVQQGELLLLARGADAARAHVRERLRIRVAESRRLERLQAGLTQHHDQALGGVVVRGDGHVLRGDELRELRGWQRLGSCWSVGTLLVSIVVIWGRHFVGLVSGELD